MFLLLSSWSMAGDVVIDPKIEIPLVITGLGGYYLLQNQQPRDTSTIAQPQGIDLWGTPRWNDEMIPFSDFMGHPLKLYGFNLPILSTLAIGTAIGSKKGVKQGLVHSFVVVEAVVTTVFITQGLKNIISRPRPFTSLAFQEQYPDVYAGEYIQEELETWDAWMSMPSGHTSVAGATYTSIATLLSAHDPQNKFWFYGGAATLTLITGYSRVAAGMHHPTDVIAGGLLGAAIGYGITQIHLTNSNISAQLAAPNMIQVQGAW